MDRAQATAPESGTRNGTGMAILHANRMEDLRELLIRVMRDDPLAPLEQETILIQSNGMAQWLKLALAEQQALGICAATEFVMPASFIWRCYRAVLGRDELPQTSPYDKQTLTWRLLRLLPELLAQPAFEPLQRYLADDADLRKRYQLAQRLADLFDQYQIYRADWLEQWAKGVDEPRTLVEQQPWQPLLWRAIRDSLPESECETSRADVHRRFLQKLDSLPSRPAGLPRRIMVFGISSLPQQTLETLSALGRWCQVYLFVLNPCRFYWGDIIDQRDGWRLQRGRHEAKPGMPQTLKLEELHLHANPLLAAWGKQGRDYIGLLYNHDQALQSSSEIDVFVDVTDGQTVAPLLQQVQQAVLDLEPLPGPEQPKRLVTGEDTSVQFQLGHSPQREVEILHDRLLALFEDEALDLKPRDVIVMAPDIDAYAPHIEAVFADRKGGQPASGHGRPMTDKRYIPYTIADRPERTSNPLLRALEKLLELHESRFAVSELLDLLDVPAFRRRFEIDDPELPKLHRWIDEAGIRWGLDEPQRETLALPRMGQNSWRFGLKRMLLGYAAGESEIWRDIAPYDEVGGLDAALAGKLAHCLDALESQWRQLRQDHTAGQWRQRLLALWQHCLLPEGSQEEKTLLDAERALDAVVDACAAAELEEPLPLVLIRDALLGQLDSEGLSQRFLAGRVNFCTLMPMRAIPFKVVCLLGMNDGAYPRLQLPLDFDLMAGDYRPGDRSRREDDRYLFLEALLSAREQLYISYIGNSVRDNSDRTPSVLVGQLRDYLAAGWQLAGDSNDDGQAGERLLDHLSVAHPLQPFSRRYFLPPQASRHDPRLFSYAAEWIGVHGDPDDEGEASGENAAQDSLPLPPPVWPADRMLNLADLAAFLRQPIQYFFNQRLQVHFEAAAGGVDDHEPFGIDHLQAYSHRDALLRACLDAEEEAEMQQQLQRRTQRLVRSGLLPVGGFGKDVLRELTEQVTAGWQQYRSQRARFSKVLEPKALNLTLQPAAEGEPFDLQLQDWLDHLYTDPEGQQWVRLVVRPSSYGFEKSLGEQKTHYWFQPWTTHLAACAQGIPLTSVLICLDGPLTLAPITQGRAYSLLQQLVTSWWQGLRQPLPVVRELALDHYLPGCGAQAEVDPDEQAEALQRAARYYDEGDYLRGPLCADPYLGRVYSSFDMLWETGFSDWTTRLYGPLWQHLEEALEQADSG